MTVTSANRHGAPTLTTAEEVAREFGESVPLVLDAGACSGAPSTVVDCTELPVVDKHLAEVASSHAGFDLHLRGSATFRPVSPVVFVAVAAGISECELLAADVRSGPLDRELPYPFHPHVTVAHDLPDADMDRAFEALADYECRFTVDSFALFAHDAAQGWFPQREFALART